MAPSSLRLHLSLSGSWDLKVKFREALFPFCINRVYYEGRFFDPALQPWQLYQHRRQVCCTRSFNSRHLLAQQIHHFLASCLLGAAQERCLFLLVK